MYTVNDVEKTVPRFKGIPPSQWLPILKDVKARFQYNGHILGATYIELYIHGKHFVFSGDICRTNDLLLYPPLKPTNADVLFIEATDGVRFHPEEEEAITHIE